MPPLQLADAILETPDLGEQRMEGRVPLYLRHMVEVHNSTTVTTTFSSKPHRFRITSSTIRASSS